MKSWLVLPLTFALGVLTAPQATSERSSTPVIAKDEPVLTSVRDFWSASLNGDAAKMAQLTSEAPNDYYVMVNRCTGESKEARTNLVKNAASPSFGNEELPRVLDPSDRDFLSKSVQDFSLRIKREGLTEYRVAGVIRHENQAVVRIQYGRVGEINNTGYILMSASHDEWKVIMVDGGYYLAFDNPYFALGSCDETAVTRLAWEPVIE